MTDKGCMKIGKSLNKSASTKTAANELTHL